MTLISKADAQPTLTSSSEKNARSDTFNSSLYTPFVEEINGYKITAKPIGRDVYGKQLWEIEVVTTDGRKAKMIAPLQTQFNKSNFSTGTYVFKALNKQLGGYLLSGALQQNLTQTVPSSPMGGLKTGNAHSTTVYNSKELTEKNAEQVIMGFGEVRNNTMASIGDFVQNGLVKGDLGLGQVRNNIMASAGEAVQYSPFPGIRKFGKFISTTYNNDTTARQKPGHVLDLPKLGKNISDTYNKDAAAQLKRGYNPDGTAAKITRAASEAIPMVVGGGIVVRGLLKIPAVATLVVRGAGWVASKPLLAGGLKIGGTALVAAPVLTSAVDKNVEGVTKSLIYAGAAGAGVKMVGKAMNGVRSTALRDYAKTLAKMLKTKHSNPFAEGHGRELQIHQPKNIAPYEAATPTLGRWSSLFPNLTEAQTRVLLEQVEALVAKRGVTLAEVETMFLISRNAKGNIIPSLAIAQAVEWKSAVKSTGILFEYARPYITFGNPLYKKGISAAEIIEKMKPNINAIREHFPQANYSELQREITLNSVLPEVAAINQRLTRELTIKAGLSKVARTEVNAIRIDRNCTPEFALKEYKGRAAAKTAIKVKSKPRGEDTGLIHGPIERPDPTVLVKVVPAERGLPKPSGKRPVKRYEPNKKFKAGKMPVPKNTVIR